MDNNEIIEKNTPSQKGLIVTSDSVFVNAEGLFIEYFDVIRAPWYIFMLGVKNSPFIDSIVDLGYMKHVGELGWMEWYVNRKIINPLKSFPINPEFAKEYGESGLDDLLNKEMDNEDVMLYSGKFPFFDILGNLVSVNVAKNIYIYTPEYHKLVAYDIDQSYGQRIKYVYGSFDDAIEDIPEDSTYVFSDVRKVQRLAELNRLSYTSILLAEHYEYNYNDDGNLIIDLDGLSQSNLFHFNLFDNKTI